MKIQTSFVQNVHFPLEGLGDQVNNQDVFIKIGLPELLRQSAEGRECTVIAFGQTGSGKTYSISALANAVPHSSHVSRPLASGHKLYFEAFQLAAKGASDLLVEGRRVSLLTDASGNTQQSNLEKEEIMDVEALAAAYARAIAARDSDSTARNPQSSRTHAFYRLSFPSGGRFTLVDLAGSEGHRDSMLHDSKLMGDTAFISQSLGVLKECIRQLSIRAQAKDPKAHGRVPFRDSPLTRCLQRALEGGDHGQVRTVILACVSPCAGDTEQTCITLRSASFMAGASAEGHTWRDGAKLPVVSKSALEGLHQDVRMALDEGQELVHPFKWTNSELVSWLLGVDGGRFARFADAVGNSTDGKALKKWPPMRFRQLCGGSETEGKRLKAALDCAKSAADQYTKVARSLDRQQATQPQAKHQCRS